MNAPPRKKSPRAPTLSLEDAVDRTTRLYEKEARHAAPAEVVAQNLGYKSASNGAAAQALASLRYYGLIERPKEGYLAVSKNFEAYRFSPDESTKRSLLTSWLKTPPVFAELIEKYGARLPSDGVIKFDLIQKGFSAAAADVCVSVFRKSVEFAQYDGVEEVVKASDVSDLLDIDDEQEPNESPSLPSEPTEPKSTSAAIPGNLSSQSGFAPAVRQDAVRVPVRLPKGRCAWLELPIPLFEADKQRLKAFIDLQLTDDGDDQDTAQN